MNFTILYHGPRFRSGKPEKYSGTMYDVWYWAKIQARAGDFEGADEILIYSQGGWLLADYKKKGSRWTLVYKDSKWKV